MSGRRLPVWPPWRLLGETQMLIFRLVVGLLLVAALFCFGMYIGTGQVQWRQRGLMIVKWTVLAALGFFAVLILERLALVL